MVIDYPASPDTLRLQLRSFRFVQNAFELPDFSLNSIRNYYGYRLSYMQNLEKVISITLLERTTVTVEVRKEFK